MSGGKNPVARHLGLVDYEPTWRRMQEFTDRRSADTADEIWFLEHPPVFTMGMNASPEHLLMPGDIPVIKVDRGGQVTYHGPGQVVVYPLIDMERARLNVRELVCALEQSVIDLAGQWGIRARGSREAPGVYVNDSKLASIGLRIRKGCSYHGLALNVDMDLEPFSRINPCGYRGLSITRLADLGVDAGVSEISRLLERLVIQALGLQSGPADFQQPA